MLSLLHSVSVTYHKQQPTKAVTLTFGSLYLSCFVLASGDLGGPILFHMFARLIMDEEIKGF